MATRNSVIFCVCVVVIVVFSVSTSKVNGFEDYMKVGDVCERDDDCSEIPNAVCDERSEECDCRPEHVPTSNATICLKLAKKLGDACEVEEQCKGIPKANCLENICVVAAAVEKTPIIEMSKDELCNGSKNGLDCSFGQCQNGSCGETPKTFDLQVIGRFCKDDSECHIPGTVCSTQKCLCTDDYVSSQNLKACLAKAEAFGDECIESVQCLALNGVCMNGKCSEKMTSFFKVVDGPDETRHSPLLGSNCLVDDDCRGISNAVCNEKVCECIKNYVTSVSSDSCLKKAINEGDPCEIDKQCEDVNGATCSGNKCIRIALVGRIFAKEANKVSGMFSHSSTSVLSAGFVVAILYSKIRFL